MALRRNPPACNPREGALQYIEKDWLGWLVRACVEVCIDPNLQFFPKGANHPVVDILLMCAMKSLLLWITCVQCKNNIKYRISAFVRRYAQVYYLFGSYLRMDVFCVCMQIFLIMILAFQRWIICAYEQVPRDMDLFCLRTQLFLK